MRVFLTNSSITSDIIVLIKLTTNSNEENKRGIIFDRMYLSINNDKDISCWNITSRVRDYFKTSNIKGTQPLL